MSKNKLLFSTAVISIFFGLVSCKSADVVEKSEVKNEAVKQNDKNTEDKKAGKKPPRLLAGFVQFVLPQRTADNDTHAGKNNGKD